MTCFETNHPNPCNNGDGLDPPKSISQVLLHQLSKPSLCFISLVLLELIHGMSMLESLMYFYYSNDGDNVSPKGESLLIANYSSFAICQQENDHNATNSVQLYTQVSFIMALLLRQLVRPASALFVILLLIMALLVLQYSRLSKIIVTMSYVPLLKPLLPRETSLSISTVRHPLPASYPCGARASRAVCP